jgi:hypothetical protein
MKMKELFISVFILSALLATTPVLAGETIVYPGVPLQTIGTETYLAPSSSDTNKSTSLAGNSVTLNSGTVDYVYGALNMINHDTDSVSGNKVFVYGGTTKSIYGGRSDFGNATGNTVTISSGTVDKVYGGFSIGDTSSPGIPGGNATGYRVTMNSGKVNFSVVGGYTSYGKATGNTVSINGISTFDTGAGIYGGISTGGDKTTGNTLMLNIAISVGEVNNFENYEFRILTSASSDAVLTVAVPVNLSNTSVDITSISLGFTPTPGKVATLISKVSGVPSQINGKPYVANANITATRGVWKFSTDSGALTATFVSIDEGSSGGGGCGAGLGAFGLLALAGLFIRKRR